MNIEEAIAIIEAEGYYYKIEHNKDFRSPTGECFLLRNVIDNVVRPVIDRDIIIKYARKCQLKVFW